MEFSKKLKILAGQHRYSQSMLARELGVSQNLVSLWTRGASIPDLYEAARIAKLFRVDVNYLADDALDEEPAVELTEEERAIVALIRAKRLSLTDAVKRLDADPDKVRQPEPPAYRPGPASWARPQRDETAAELRRMQEGYGQQAPAPKEPEEAGRASGGKRPAGKKGTERR